ncbi:hypothetical protein DMN91_001590 [Ooceraea biroi]|uniref:Uncharacterized protein n=1 Tax=Ooceraea biroi TaxID=2015173 RepID=A0A3L8DYB3_OOCBI|nr:hypothetical protein DMN91_001590 [Ooceraea biroi]
MRTLYLPWMYYFKVVIVIILIFIIEIAIAITKPSLSTNKTENDKESSDTGSNQDNNDTIYFVFLRWIGICIFSVIVICLGYSICKCWNLEILNKMYSLCFLTHS